MFSDNKFPQICAQKKFQSNTDDCCKNSILLTCDKSTGLQYVDNNSNNTGCQSEYFESRYRYFENDTHENGNYSAHGWSGPKKGDC